MHDSDPACDMWGAQSHTSLFCPKVSADTGHFPPKRDCPAQSGTVGQSACMSHLCCPTSPWKITKYHRRVALFSPWKVQCCHKCVALHPIRININCYCDNVSSEYFIWLTPHELAACTFSTAMYCKFYRCQIV